MKQSTSSPAPLTSGGNRSPVRPRLALAVGLAVATLAVYWPSTTHEFLNYDDTDYVTENAVVLAGLTWKGVVWAFTQSHSSNWHPLTWISHMLDVQLFGLNAGAHHLVNVLLHAVNAALLFLLLNRITGALWRSGVVAALFALHPLHVESVAWVAERKDVLSTFFGMLTIWFYARYVASRSALNSHLSTLNYSLALVFFALGLMSKPLLVTLPFVFLLLDYWPLRRFELATAGFAPSILFRLAREKIPFFALTAASCVVTLWAQQIGGAVRSLEAMSLDLRVGNALLSTAGYLQKAMWPADLAAFYPLPASLPAWRILLALTVLGSISVVTVCQVGQRPYLLVGWLWYLGTLLPMLGLVQVGMQAMADRYTYLPLIGIFIALSWGIADIFPRGRRRQAILGAAATVVLTACLVAARRQLGCWANSGALFARAIEVTRDNYLAHHNLGQYLFTLGQLDEAIHHYRTALHINPAYDDAHSNLAHALAVQQRLDESLYHYRTALRLRPGNYKTRNNLANVLAMQGRLGEAIVHYEEAVRLRPDHAPAHNNLALTLEQQGNAVAAIRHYREALRLNPGMLEALNNLAWLLATHPDAKLRNGTEAVALAQRACQLTAYNHPVPLATLSAGYAETGRFAEALTTAQMACEAAIRSSQTELAGKLRRLLECYRIGTPFRGAI